MIGARRLFATQPAAGGFVPTDISGLSSWLDASDTATITHTGGSVSAWADKTANGNDATVTTATVTTGTRTQNSLNALDFDGTSALMSWFQPSSANATIFVVGKLDTTSAVRRRIISNYSGSGMVGVGGWLLDWTESPAAVRFLRQSVITSRAATRDTLAHLFVAQNSASASLVRFDGIETTGSGYATAPASTLYIAEDAPPGGLAEYWDGIICEILYYEAVLSASEISNVETYLNDKWGL